MLQELPAAVITRDAIKFFMTEDRLRDGIRIEEQLVLARISSWPRPWTLSSDTGIKNLLRTL
jgi:hypothetical protein